MQSTSESLRFGGLSTSLASNDVLETLSLNSIRITITGVWQLCIALQVNTHLKKLCLRDSIILDSTTIDQLNVVLKLNSTLQTLHLNFDSCFCDGDTFMRFLEALQMNMSLETLSMTGLENTHTDKINFVRTKQSIRILTIK